MKTINRIIYDWYATPENGEEFKEFQIGKGGVKSIKEHAALGEGDKWYYDIEFLMGDSVRVFNINKVFYQ